MADFTYGVSKINGAATFDSALSLSLDFWTLSFNMNLLSSSDPSGLGNSYTQAALNKIVEIVSEKGQPVLLDLSTMNASTGVSTLRLAIEHRLSWNTNEGTPPVYGIGAAGAATDNGVAALQAKLIADGVNIAYQPVYNAWATGVIPAGTVVKSGSNYYMTVVGGTAATAPTGTVGGSATIPGDGLVYWYLGNTLPLTITNLVNAPVYSASL